MNPRVLEALSWLVSEVSCTPFEFRAQFQPDGDELLDGLKSRSMIVGNSERIAASAYGINVLRANRPEVANG